MKVLALNSGSSSLKFQLVETDEGLMREHADVLLAKGNVTDIGTPGACLSLSVPGLADTAISVPGSSHDQAVHSVLARLLDHSQIPVTDADAIEAIGHRVVHGGECFRSPVFLDEGTLDQIREANELAPLHNAHNLQGYAAAHKALPGRPHVAVFDTSFHQTLAPQAYLYALPYELYTELGIRRYGFHGISHRYVAERFAQLVSKPIEDTKLITCHLGNGCSVCAIRGGVSVDTSMGFTPSEGLVMGTRPGDVDAAAVLHVLERRQLTPTDGDGLLNEQSGLYGLSGVSSDMRSLLIEASGGSSRAQLAIDVFCYRLKKYIGAYYASLNGVDALVFTAGIGENAPLIRKQTCDLLESLGIALDPQANNATVGVEGRISTANTPTQVWVIPTNEELLIARETCRCVVERPNPEP